MISRKKDLSLFFILTLKIWTNFNDSFQPLPIFHWITLKKKNYLNCFSRYYESDSSFLLFIMPNQNLHFISLILLLLVLRKDYEHNFCRHFSSYFVISFTFKSKHFDFFVKYQGRFWKFIDVYKCLIFLSKLSYNLFQM